MRHETAATASRWCFVQVAVIVLVTSAAYSGSLRGTFVSDDTVEVANRPLIRSLDGAHVREMLTTFDGPNYTPVTVLSLAVNYRLLGPHPWGFHLGNLLIHIAAALTVYALLQRLTPAPTVACIAALLWAIHPLQVESIAWISERKNVLSGLFFFAAFHSYLAFSERPRARTYCALVAFYLLAVLAKMNTMVLPAVCLAYEAAFRFRLRRLDVIATLPLFGLGALVAWYNLAGNPIHGGDYWGGSALVTWMTSTVVVFRYLRNVLVPTDLCVFYDVPLRDSLLDAPVLLSVLGLLGLMAAVIWSVRRKHPEGFWILWFGITLAPMLNIIPFRSLMNDRYMYLPILGPLALVCTAGSVLARRRSLRGPLLAGAAAVVVTCAGLTFRRVDIWANPFAMWKDWVARTYYMGGEPIFRQEDLEAKITYLRGIAVREPSLAVARGNLGAIYFENGWFAEALSQLQAARQLAPTQAVISYNLGRAYARVGRLQDAKSELERAAQLDPYAFMTHLTLARVSRAVGDATGERKAYAACARLRPTDFNSSPFFLRDRENLHAVDDEVTRHQAN